MTHAVVILWCVWAALGQPLDARPSVQFDTMKECLEFVVWQQKQAAWQANEKKMLEMEGTTTTLLCLPAGVRP